jgi:hypothetical protein
LVAEVSFWKNTLLLSTTALTQPLPSFVGITYTGDSSNNPVTIGVPAGIQAGDFMVAFLWFTGGTATGSTLPSGWTLGLNDFSGTVRLSVYYKTAGGSETSFSWTRNGTGLMAGHVEVWRNVAGFNIGTKMTPASTTTAVAPSLTASLLGILLASFFRGGAAGSVATPPAGMTQRDFQSAFGTTIAHYELSPSPAGATGTKTLVWNAGNQTAAVMVQIY